MLQRAPEAGLQRVYGENVSLFRFRRFGLNPQMQYSKSFIQEAEDECFYKIVTDEPIRSIFRVLARKDHHRGLPSLVRAYETHCGSKPMSQVQVHFVTMLSFASLPSVTMGSTLKTVYTTYFFQNRSDIRAIAARELVRQVMES